MQWRLFLSPGVDFFAVVVVDVEGGRSWDCHGPLSVGQKKWD